MCKQALALVARLLDCEIGDAQEVLRLVQLHGEEVPRNAREFAKEAGRPRTLQPPRRLLWQALMLELKLPSSQATRS